MVLSSGSNDKCGAETLVVDPTSPSRISGALGHEAHVAQVAQAAGTHSVQTGHPPRSDSGHAGQLCTGHGLGARAGAGGTTGLGVNVRMFTNWTKVKSRSTYPTMLNRSTMVVVGCTVWS